MTPKGFDILNNMKVRSYEDFHPSVKDTIYGVPMLVSNREDFPGVVVKEFPVKVG